MDQAVYASSSSEQIVRRTERNPSSAELRFFLGLKFADEGNLAAAAEAFNCALTLKPEFADAAFNLGRVSFELERYDAAKRAFLRTRGSTLENQSLEFLGEICRLTGDAIEARDYYLAAINSGESRSHIPHLGLTKLHAAGVDLGLPQQTYPFFDERVKVSIGGQTVYTRLRIFRDLTEPERRVVIFTDEAANKAQGRIGTSVINGAEVLIEFVLANPKYAVSADTATWVILHENGGAGFGLKPMRLSKLEFALQAPALKEQSLFEFLYSAIFCTLPIPAEAQRVHNLEFKPISHPELETLTGVRYYWGPR